MKLLLAIVIVLLAGVMAADARPDGRRDLREVSNY